MKTLDPAVRRALRAKAHHLDPVVSIGNHGLTPAVLHEIDVNLLAHELVKLRVHDDDRGEREMLLARICDALDAAPVQHLGKVLIIYRERIDQEEPASKPAAGKRPRPSAATRSRTTPPAPNSRSRGNTPVAANKAPRARRRLG